MILLDANPFAGGFGVFIGVAFLLVFLAIAFIAFKLLKRTVKMAFRIAIVVIIIAVAVAAQMLQRREEALARSEDPRAQQQAGITASDRGGNAHSGAANAG